MQPPPRIDSDSPNESVNPDTAARQSVVRNALSSLKGWQAIPAVIIALYLVLGIFGPILAPLDPEKSGLRQALCPPLAIDALALSDRFSEPNLNCRSANILGTDYLGRDVFSRLLHGARTSFLVVVPSVVIGTAVGSVIAALLNGWRRRPRLIAYALLALTIVPFAVLAFAQPQTLYIFGAIGPPDTGLDWSAVLALSSFSAVLTFVIVGVAYQYDERCHRSWFAEVDSEGESSGFSQLLYREIFTLAPWIGLAAFANAALVFLQSGTAAYMPSVITWSSTWSSDRLHVDTHIGMLSSLVPMVLFPLGFVTFGTWWFMCHVRHRIKAPSKVDAGASETDGSDALSDVASGTSRRHLAMAVISIVVAAAVIHFAVAQVVPIVREIAQDAAGDYQSSASKDRRGRSQTLDCANEIGAKLMTFSALPPEQQEVDPGQRCLDLYYENRNAPSHRLTIDYALRFISQTLTLTLIASIVSALLWSASSVSTRTVKWIVEVCVTVVALIGLTMTFGIAAWHLLFSLLWRWFDAINITSLDLVTFFGVFSIVGDFTVALGISYLTIVLLKPTIRFAKTVPTLDVLYNRASFLVPSALLTSGLLILFHYHFPANFLIYDDVYGVIANPTMDGYFARGLIIHNWLWTYWFALIGYATIVFGFFAAASLGFRRFARRDADGIEPTPGHLDSSAPPSE